MLKKILRPGLALIFIGIIILGILLDSVGKRNSDPTNQKSPTVSIIIPIQTPSEKTSMTAGNSENPAQSPPEETSSSPGNTINPVQTSPVQTGTTPGITISSARTSPVKIFTTPGSIKSSTQTPSVHTSTSPGNMKNSPADDISFRFVAMADSRGDDHGIHTSIIKKTLDKIKSLSPQPSFAAMPGDLVDSAQTYSGIKSQLEYFKSTITKYYPERFFYPGIGNHEVTALNNGEKAFSEVFQGFTATFFSEYNRTVYSFNYGNTQFFMLNSNHTGESNTISKKQLNWIKSSIDTRKKYHIFFMHDPPYPTGSHVGSSLDSNRFLRDSLWQLIDSTSGPMVFCGHEHNYTRRHINSDFNETVKGINFKFSKNIFQVTVGSFGAPLYKEFSDKKNVDVPPVAKYHYAVVDIDNTGIHVKVYDLDGNTLDEF